MGTEFAERFTRARQEKNYTQQSIAERLGVTPQAVSKWEKGLSLPDTEMLKSIAVFLNCSMDYLMGHTVTEENHVTVEILETKSEIEGAILKDILEVKVGQALVDMLMEENKAHFRIIHDLRLRIAGNYGVIVPIIRLRDDLSLQEKEYRIALHGRDIAGGRVEYPLYFHIGREAENPEEIEGRDPVSQKKGVWKPDEISGNEKREGISAMQMIIAHLEQMILKHYDRILNRQITADMVEMLHCSYPAVTEGVVPEKISYSLLQKVIAGAVKKGCGVPSLAVMIEMLEDKIEEAACGNEAPVRVNVEEFLEEYCRHMA